MFVLAFQILEIMINKCNVESGGTESRASLVSLAQLVWHQFWLSI